MNNRIIKIAIIFLIGATLLIQTSCFITESKITTTKTARPDVVYEITGTADKVDITLANNTGGTEQYDDVYLPRSYRYYSFEGWHLYISAQNQGDKGTVIVNIYINGKIVKTSTSSGAYVIATASYSLLDW